MVEERWHDFAKEKPSEDMEGRNFIVSNGHYEKISTWCGYWENEPFMGDRLCDEVVRWKFYFTPEEEKANEATRTEPKPMKCDELEAENEKLRGESCKLTDGCLRLKQCRKEKANIADELRQLQAKSKEAVK